MATGGVIVVVVMAAVVLLARLGARAPFSPPLTHTLLRRRLILVRLLRLVRLLLLLLLLVVGLLPQLGACCSALSPPPSPIRVLPLPYQAPPNAPRWTAETGMRLGGVCVHVFAVLFLYNSRSNCLLIAMHRGKGALDGRLLCFYLYK
jgi:hypothetical protein